MASLAIDAPTKWTDNIISQLSVPGVATVRRGVARRIPRAALLLLAVTRELHLLLGMSVRDALALAGDLVARGADRPVQRGALTVSLDLAAIERSLDERLRDALEYAPAPRRGRPPRRGARG